MPAQKHKGTRKDRYEGKSTYRHTLVQLTTLRDKCLNNAVNRIMSKQNVATNYNDARV